jgi:putative transcriptional regulator
MPKDDPKLIEYALGILDKEARETLERELSTSSEAENMLSEIEAVLAEVALAETPLQPNDRVRRRVLASLDRHNGFEGFVERLVTFFDLSGERIRELLDATDSVPEQPWEPSGVPGISFLHFEGGTRVVSADCGLVHVHPGTSFPAHRHVGEEWVFIIQGRAQEDSGEIWAPGDLVYRAPDSGHAFRVIGDEPLIYAVVLHKGFAWTEEVNGDY